MRIIYSILGVMMMTLSSHTFAGWQVSLQNDDSGTSVPRLIVSNDVERRQVMVYLVWANLNTGQFSSWLFDQGWHSELKPVFDDPINLPTFESYNIDFEDKACPDEDQCLLAYVAAPPDKEPTDMEAWKAASLLPLSLAAAQERRRGQVFFLPPSNDNVARGDFDEEAVALDGVAQGVTTTTADTEAAPSAPSADKASGNGAPAETEKPDIFKQIGDKILFANGQAQRFQVIDISDTSNPTLTGSVALEGNPRELYVLNDYYVLLQTTYANNESRTIFTVLQQNADGTLTEVPQTSSTLSGGFIESRRRNDIIYTITQDYVETTPTSNGIVAETEIACFDCFIPQTSMLNINALRLTEAGQLEKVTEEQVLGYSPNVAIFTNHLVIANHNPEEESWLTTQIQAFDLSQDNPLVALPTLTVPGRVPSEFHLSIQNEQLRVVYGPENREAGSTLAIYDLPEMNVVGTVDKIAPGEDLFATRFENNRAFVVTYERIDPLWVIDLTNPAQPTILGELKVPGWSEKMFFHDDKLFAIGIHDQPLEGEDFQWASRVAISLFDVKDPTKPSLIKRLVPFEGEASSSYSDALYDERALLLNWEDTLAALPIYSWETKERNHLQIISLADDTLTDAGRLNSTVQIQRSTPIADDVLAALGDQALMTLRWGVGQQPEVLGELELAINLNWLKLKEDDLWAAARGNSGYHRFYRYTTADVETPAERWDLEVGNNSLATDGESVVFYGNFYASPLTVQLFDLNSRQLNPVLELDKQETTTTAGEEPDPPADGDIVEKVEPFIAPVWYSRTQPMVHDGFFYLSEQRPVQSDTRRSMPFVVPEHYSRQTQWMLRGWDLNQNGKEAPMRSIPGTPLAITANGELITQEYTPEGQRFNLLELTADSANLLQTRELACLNYSAQVIWAENALYMTCRNGQPYYPGPIILEDAVDSASSDDVAETAEKAEQPVQEQPELTTDVIKLAVVEQQLVDEGRWTLDGFHHIQAASQDTVLLAAESYYYGPYYTTVTMDMAEPALAGQAPAELPEEQTGCNIYQFLPEQEPVLLKHLETCYYGQHNWALTSTKAWRAEGFAGIKEINW
jgi:uncharacterized secreted protein with C-terminal beta-propeller domain